MDDRAPDPVRYALMRLIGELHFRQPCPVHTPELGGLHLARIYLLLEHAHESTVRFAIEEVIQLARRRGCTRCQVRVWLFAAEMAALIDRSRATELIEQARSVWKEADDSQGPSLFYLSLQVRTWIEFSRSHARKAPAVSQKTPSVGK